MKPVGFWFMSVYVGLADPSYLQHEVHVGIFIYLHRRVQQDGSLAGAICSGEWNGSLFNFHTLTTTLKSLTEYKYTVPQANPQSVVSERLATEALA
jgi:hypothetical protein